jgi:chorismate mutase/prephenate dehydratase
MSQSLDLNEIRKEITELDGQLLKFFARRRELTLNVAKSKAQQVRPVRDQTREQELLVRLIKQGKEYGLDAHYITNVFHVIIEDSVLNQQAYLQTLINPNIKESAVRVAFLGDKGSYSYLASHRYFSRRAEKIFESGCQTFAQILQQVECGEVDYGMLPIENTSSGSINEVYDLLQHTNLSIVGELSQPIEHCLLAATTTNLGQITTIYSHAQPHAQCSNFLAKLQQKVHFEFCESTADAMSKASEAKQAHIGVIGSEEGGLLYGLHTIESNIANQSENHSRFILVARKPVDVAEQIPAKTTLILATGQRPGALADCLMVLKNHDINMTKLESRPIPGRPWEEMFYLDIEGNVKTAKMQETLIELTKISNFIKVLGCYPSERIVPTEVPSSAIC